MSECLYVRNTMNSVSSEEDLVDENDAWDDSALIAAYNKAVNMAKEKIAKKISFENGLDQETKPSTHKKRSRNKPKSQGSPKWPEHWKEGDPCRTVFSADGKEYEATVKAVFPRRNTCIVVYVGYNNEEEVELGALQQSNGEDARKAQELESAKCDDDSRGFPANPYLAPPGDYHSEDLGVIPPPPPPNVMAHFPKDESDALSAMLMAWYMSGYHTGYYQGLTRSKAPRSFPTRPN